MIDPYEWNIRVKLNRDFEVRFEFQNSDLTPMDLTGYTPRAQIRIAPAVSSDLIVEFTTEVVMTLDVDNVLTKSEVVLTLSVLDLELITEPIHGFYDLLLKDPDTKEFTYVQGTACLEGSVTENV